jgi:hypothetical protein
VRHGGQEQVLHLIQRPQLAGGLPLALQRFPLPEQRLMLALKRLMLRCQRPLHRLLGQLLLGDVDHDPVPKARLAVVASDQHGMVTDPDHPAILGELTVFHAPGVAGPFAAGILGQHPLAVLGMQDRLPEPGPPGLLRAVAEEILDPWALIHP